MMNLKAERKNNSRYIIINCFSCKHFENNCRSTCRSCANSTLYTDESYPYWERREEQND